MDKRTVRWVKYSVAVVLVLVLGFLGYTYPLPDAPESGVEAKAVERGALLCATESGNCVESWNGSDFQAFSDAGSTQTFLMDGATGDVTATDVTVNADFVVDDTFNIDDTAYTSTGAQTLDPVASHYLLAPTAALTLTLATTTAVTGDFVWFVSNVATSTVIVDTTATAGGGNRTLGVNDVIGFIFDGATWNEAFYSDNS